MTELEDMTPQEALAHFGKKGMKWGVRNNTETLSGAKGKTKTAKEQVSTSQILDARARHNARVSKIYAADSDVRLATTKKGKADALKVVDKYAKQIASSDDARIGSKMTKGEKIATSIVLGPIGVAMVVANNHQTKKP